MKLIDNVNIVVATSIAPKNMENQVKAISSWENAGFRIVSLNCTEEVEKLSHVFPNVEFISVDSDAREQFGKPYVYFNHFLDYFQTCSEEICGIINSDIHFPYADLRFKSFIYSEARNSLVHGSRMDVSELDDENGVMHFTGFDYFFLDKGIVPFYPREDFCIGLPGIDYWIALIPLIHKIPVKRIINPLAYHVIHQTNWDRLSWEKYASILTRYSKRLESSNSAKTLGSNVYEILRRIHLDSTPLVYVESKSIESTVLVIINSNSKPEHSKTYLSVQEQTYKNINIMFIKNKISSLNSVKEDYVLSIDEGYILNRHCIEFMVHTLNQKVKYDYVVCGIRYHGLLNWYFGDYYPIYKRSNDVTIKEINSNCILYKTRSFIEGFKQQGDYYNKKMNFQGITLVETGTDKLIKDRLSRCVGHNENLYIYCAGGHTEELLRVVDFSKYHLCGIIDKDKEKVGNHINGYPIVDIETLNKNQIDFILISSISYEDEIYNELKLEIEENKLIKIYN
jgi:hypothetical protein